MHQPGERDRVGEPQQIVLLVSTEHDAVVRDRRGEQRGRERREQQDGDVQPVLFGIERREQVGERHREQEPEQHLHAESGDPQLLEQLGHVAVDAFGFGLVSPVRGPTWVRSTCVMGSFVPRTCRTPVACGGPRNQGRTMSELPATLQVQDLGDGRWSAPHPTDDPEGRDVVFSGQILAQMIMASDANCGSQKEVKSIHAIFARAGTYSAGPMELRARRHALGAGVGERHHHRLPG